MSEQKISILRSFTMKISLVDTIVESTILDEKNYQVLQILDMFNNDFTLAEENSVKNYELQRIEAKLDGLLLMMAQILSQQINSETLLCKTNLSADYLLIETEHIIDLNSNVLIELYLEQYCPQPLLLSGKVIDVAAIRNGLMGLLIQFINIGSATQAYLEKLIFRLHRKQIAKQKLQQSS